MLRVASSILFVAAVALLLIAPTACKADGISENFNAVTPALNATNIGSFFTVTGGAVDIVGGALFGNLCVAPESGNCLDMDGSNGTAGQISSATMSLAPGTYTLSFDLIGSQRGVTTSTTVTLGSLFTQTFSLGSSDVTSGIVNDTIVVGSATDAALVFTSNTPGNIGALLDNVNFASASVATPEPATLSLLGIGLVGLIARRRRATTK
jgi:PEP-CTERM motif